MKNLRFATFIRGKVDDNGQIHQYHEMEDQAVEMRFYGQCQQCATAKLRKNALPELPRGWNFHTHFDPSEIRAMEENLDTRFGTGGEWDCVNDCKWKMEEYQRR